MPVTIGDFTTPVLPTWCPGCGDFAIWTSIKQALVQEGKGPRDVLLCFDIGCNGNMADKINAYVFKGLHGRVIPVAAGASLANFNLPVIAVAGDGGTFDEGMHHFIHGIRSNYNITFIIHNNCDFGLTTGQPTPTTPQGLKMTGAPYGVVETRINPIKLALSVGAGFIARGFTGNIPQLISLIKTGLNYPGFAYIDVLQHCPTYNYFQDHQWLMNKVYDVSKDENYKNTREYAYNNSDINEDKIATGVLFRDDTVLPYEKRLEHRNKITTMLKDEVKDYDVTSSILKFT